MTMDISKKEVEYLSSTLETHTVTYRTAARDLNIHISKSKQMLYEYYNLNRTTVNASFAITGTRHGNTIVQIFNSEDEFSSQKDQFEEVRAVHVYCLMLAKNHPLVSDIAIEDQRNPVDLADLGRYYKLGLTKGVDIANIEHLDKKPVERLQKLEPKLDLKESKMELAATASSKPKLEYQSRKEKARAPSLISNYVSRKGEAKTAVPAKRENSAKTSYQYKSRKLEQSQPKERVVMSSMADDDDMDVDSAPKDVDSAPKTTGTPQASTDLNNLFLDDLSDFSDDTREDAGEEPIVVEDPEDSSPQQNELQPAKVPEDSIFRTMVNKSASPVPQQATPPPVTTVDEDGYITTYRAKESKEAKETKRVPARVGGAKPKTDKKSDGKLKQASLMSFFGKR